MSTPDRNETIVKADSRIHSATATQYRFTLHVPQVYNDGTLVSDDTVADYERLIRSSYPAGTRQREGIDGWWEDYNDPQTLYHVDTATDNDGNRLREIAAVIRDVLGQECVYVTRQAIDTWLV